MAYKPTDKEREDSLRLRKAWGEWCRTTEVHPYWLVEFESDLGIVTREVEDMLELLNEQTDGRRKRLLARFVALNVWFAADTVCRLCRQIGWITSEFNKCAERCEVAKRAPFLPGGISKNAKRIAKRLRPVRNAIAHPYTTRRRYGNRPRDVDSRPMDIWQVLWMDSVTADVERLRAEILQLREAHSEIRGWVFKTPLEILEPV